MDTDTESAIMDTDIMAVKLAVLTSTTVLDMEETLTVLDTVFIVVADHSTLIAFIFLIPVTEVTATPRYAQM
jgi:hypothetical protein